MSKKQKLQYVAQLRRERSTLVARLVKANSVFDDLRPHRLRMLKQDIATVNTKLKELTV